tara:strand:+ start:4699 stop:5949 length:1251 start_codon:yes stop_codon:yes gene_type:complete
MPRNTDDIKHSLHTNPAEAVSYGGFGRGSIWNIYPNSIGVPAGRNRGRFKTMKKLEKVQKRYWKKGIPMGMELELELPSDMSPSPCMCENECEACYENAHGACEFGVCEAYSNDGYVYYQDYDKVREVLQVINKRVQDGMKNYAIKKSQDWFHYTAPITAKGDGSLRNGVEFNLQPFTRTAFTKYAASTWQDVGYSAFEGHDTDTAGLHIHIPKAAFNDVELFMWLMLMENLSQSAHSSNGKSLLSIVGQREPCNWNGLNSTSTVTQLLDAVENRRWSQGRGLQINFNGHGNTIELRMFKANQIPERLIKNYAFVDMSWRYVHLLMDFVKDEKYSHVMQFLNNVDMFAQYITNPNAVGYTSELGTFIRKRWKSESNIYSWGGVLNPVDALRSLNENFQSKDWEDNTTQDTEEVSHG